MVNGERQMTESKRGFTIIEVVLVVAIVALLASMGLAIGVNFYGERSLYAERDTIVSILRRARTEALANINQSAHGFYAASSTYVVFQGASYAGRDAAHDETYARAAAISWRGPQEAVFSPLDAASNVSGTITISDGASSPKISVNYEGMVDW